MNVESRRFSCLFFTRAGCWWQCRRSSERWWICWSHSHWLRLFEALSLLIHAAWEWHHIFVVSLEVDLEPHSLSINWVYYHGGEESVASCLYWYSDTAKRCSSCKTVEPLMWWNWFNAMTTIYATYSISALIIKKFSLYSEQTRIRWIKMVVKHSVYFSTL